MKIKVSSLQFSTRPLTVSFRSQPITAGGGDDINQSAPAVAVPPLGPESYAGVIYLIFML